MEILGVKIDTITREEARQKVAEFLLGGRQRTIFTPNPEMIVKAQRDEYFKKVLNSGDLNLCDGFGVWLVLKLSSRASPKGATRDLCPSSPVETEISPAVEMTNTPQRIAGVDFMLDICVLAEKLGKSIYLLGSGSDEVVKKVAEELSGKFPGLRIVGTEKGPVIQETMKSRNQEINFNNVAIEQFNNEPALVIKREDDERVMSKVNDSKPDVLFVAFGMGKQEKWIYGNLSKMPSVKIAMGVGGAFDFISGKVKRAPLLMRKVGLEWVYRLYKEPRRIERIFNATVRFIWLMAIKRY